MKLSNSVFKNDRLQRNRDIILTDRIEADKTSFHTGLIIF
jgi:hypothetical protein